MSLKKNLFIINLKNYAEIAGTKTINIIREAEKVSNELGVQIIISPPQPMLALTSQNTSLMIISQHVDPQNLGSSTGFFIAEMIKSVGAVGSLLNHSEHPINSEQIEQTIKKLSTLDLLSFVCVKNLDELNMILKFGPDYVAIEPPELIGTQRSISSEKPFLISQSNEYISKGNYKSKLICGAGINKDEDIKTAIELGALGVLVASSITKAENWYKKIYELASAF